MRWMDRRRSTNVEDRRAFSPGGLAVGGGLGTLAIIVISLLLGGDPRVILDQLPGGTQVGVQEGGGPVDPAQEETKEFVSVILADTEDVWRTIFAQMGDQYREPTLVLFAGGVESACGLASSAVGPFYCPPDERVYIDLDFYDELERRFHAPGDFAQAYVLAHEVGHHVQNLLGISERVHAMQGRVSQEEYNDLSVRLELQADFLAGVWAHHAQRAHEMLEAGDLEEALLAASAIGDDRLQRESQGYIVPDSFTHGTSAQRVRWFQRGFESGDLDQGDTFSAASL